MPGQPADSWAVISVQIFNQRSAELITVNPAAKTGTLDCDDKEDPRLDIRKRVERLLQMATPEILPLLASAAFTGMNGQRSSWIG